MFETKSGLRKIATLIITAVISIAATTPAQAAVQYPKTVNYLSSQFVEGKYLLNDSGKREYGQTLEAMISLLAAGRDAKAQSKAVTFNLLSSKVTGVSSTAVGDLYTPDKRLQIGRAGMYLFTYGAFKLKPGALYRDVLKTTKVNIMLDGSIKVPSSTPKKAGQNALYSAWLTLGLTAIGEKKLATSTSNFLVTLLDPKSGAFKWNETDSALSPDIDTTGLVLVALSATKNLGTPLEKNKKLAAVASAKRWLASQSKTGDDGKFFAYGPDLSDSDWSANSTAYAAMGLKSTGSDITAYSKWLASKISTSDNGIQAGSLSKGAGNAFATLQGYTALVGKSYLDLLK